MLLRFASIKDRAAGPIGIIHQAEGLAALNGGRRVIEYLLDGILCKMN